MNLLNIIIDKKREMLKINRKKLSLADVRRRAEESERARDFSKAIVRSSGQPIRLIAEIKRASPSKGIIKHDFDLEKITEIYREKEVDAISVLTEEEYFQGSLDYITSVKGICKCPVIRKDFIFDEYQIYEARAYGADAILLIAAILSRSQADELLHLSKELGIDVLFEIHNLKELDMAIYLNCKIIGINNRNLNTLEINLNTTLNIIKDIDEDRIVVSESGINTREDVLLLEKAGADAILVGTSIMQSDDIGIKIDMLRLR